MGGAAAGRKTASADAVRAWSRPGSPGGTSRARSSWHRRSATRNLGTVDRRWSCASGDAEEPEAIRRVSADQVGEAPGHKENMGHVLEGVGRRVLMEVPGHRGEVRS